MKKLYKVDTTARIILGDGQSTYANIIFYVEGDDPKAQVFKAEQGAVVGFLKQRTTITEIGKTYKVAIHPKTSFMGVKFDADTINKVETFSTDNLIVYTDDDSYNIGYGHLPQAEREQVVNAFFKDLNLKP